MSESGGGRDKRDELEGQIRKGVMSWEEYGRKGMNQEGREGRDGWDELGGKG